MFPTISLHESFAYPTSMFLRNMMAMETEEMIKAQPMDAVVLIGGCDKTVPAQLMAAASAGIPAISVVSGPDAQRQPTVPSASAPAPTAAGLWGQHRARATSTKQEIAEISGRLVPTVGFLRRHGARPSTIACMTEAPGHDAARRRHHPGRQRRPACATPKRRAAVSSRWPRKA